ncbi:MAG: hypothetical protein SGILL_000228 [Bacillariaceae sp.]
MGRKKRKVAVEEATEEDVPSAAAVPAAAKLPQPAPSANVAAETEAPLAPVDPRQNKKDEEDEKKSSGYSMTTHSAEIVDEEIYISDGSESDEDLMAELPEQKMEEEEEQDEESNKDKARGRSIEMLLGSSKMGLMRRGIHHHSLLMQPSRQWSRQPKENSKAAGGDDGEESPEDAAAEEERRKKQEEEELAKLDPAQRAAILLAKKQRLLEEAKIHARRLESEENAGRDPLLYSKRTSFDIRFDQIDDKPWVRGGDMSDFFNYGFQEEDWLEYGEQQLLIRQELIDASRQKRQPDPSIVPVNPKTPKKLNPKVSTTTESSEGGGATEHDGGDAENAPVAGPVLVKKEEASEKPGDGSKGAADDVTQGPAKNEQKEFSDVTAGVGGAWGTGARPGSKLAKLIEEQERQLEQQQHGHPGRDPFGGGGRGHDDYGGSNRDEFMQQQVHF